MVEIHSYRVVLDNPSFRWKLGGFPAALALTVSWDNVEFNMACLDMWWITWRFVWWIISFPGQVSHVGTCHSVIPCLSLTDLAYFGFFSQFQRVWVFLSLPWGRFVHHISHLFIHQISEHVIRHRDSRFFLVKYTQDLIDRHLRFASSFPPPNQAPWLGFIRDLVLYLGPLILLSG